MSLARWLPVFVLSLSASAQVEVRVVSGDGAGDEFGSAITMLGDLNGDGRDDFAVGAPGNDAGGVSAGQVKVFSGVGQGVLWSVLGTDPGGRLGSAVANAGDIDHDGKDDLIVGAPQATTYGRAYVYSGADGSVLHSFAGVADFWSNLDDVSFGATVAGGEDLDADGTPDLIVAGPGLFDTHEGVLHVFSGATGVKFRTHVEQLTGYDHRFGHSLAFIGDLNGDGVSEYAAGAPMDDVGQGYVRTFNGATGAGMGSKYGPPGAWEFGYSLAAIGGIGGPPTPHLLIGARGTYEIGRYGRVYAGIASSYTLVATGASFGAGLGHALATLGDLDGDGIQEFAASALGVSPSFVCQDVQVCKIGNSTPLFTIPRGDPDDRFGYALASGDGNGDALRDLLIGEPRDDDNGVDSGSVHVVTFVRQPTIYCRAETNSLGCAPQVTASGLPSASSALPFDVGALNLLSNKSGLCFYGFRPQQAAFQGGYSCIKPPTLRTPTQNSGGNAAPDCSGSFALDFNLRIQSGVDPQLVAGQEVFAQFWSRDPADASTTNLTDAVAFFINP